jgi:uncharacterized protein YaiI (UPF0178 family)
MTILYVDADSCPVKDEVYRVAARYQVEVVLVSNAWSRVPLEPWIRVEVVRGEPEAADDWIAEHAGPEDLVITADVPLAGRCVARGLRALSPRGRVFDEASVGEALALRNLATHLRELGEVTGGPAPFSKRDRATFLQKLDQLLSRLPRRE